MIYDNAGFIIAAPTEDAAREQLRQYGVSDVDFPDDPEVTIIPGVVIVTAYADAVTLTDGLPSDFPWTIVDAGGLPPSLIVFMYAQFDQPQNMYVIMKALNDQFAINPKALQRG